MKKTTTATLLFSCLSINFQNPGSNAFQIIVDYNHNFFKIHNRDPLATKRTTHLYSDWSDFAYDDEDEILNIDFADENDTQEQKAEVGQMLPPPSIEFDADPIFQPAGTVLPLTVENVLGVLAACREEIGTLFGYSAENRGVGITGGVDFVELDGPIVILSLNGRFWHQRTTVLSRVASYIQNRIPEIIDVAIEDEWQLTDEANDAAL